MRPARLVALVGLGQLVRRVLADGGEQVVALAVHLEQRLVREPAQQVEHLARRDAAERGDLFGRGQGESADEDREPAEHRPFLAVEQLIRPVEGGAQRLVAGRRRPGAAGQHAEHVVEPPRELPDRQHPHPGGGQLDRQRQPVEARAHLSDRLPARVGDGEGRRDKARPVLEQPRRVRALERRYRPGAFALDAERLPAGGEHGQRRALGEQVLGEARDLRGQVLAVVEHHEQPAGPAVGGQVGGDGGGRLDARGFLHAEPARQRGRDERRIGQRRQLDPGHVPVRWRRVRPRRRAPAGSCPHRPARSA